MPKYEIMQFSHKIQNDSVLIEWTLLAQAIISPHSVKSGINDTKVASPNYIIHGEIPNSAKLQVVNSPGDVDVELVHSIGVGGYGSNFGDFIFQVVPKSVEIRSEVGPEEAYLVTDSAVEGCYICLKRFLQTVQSSSERLHLNGIIIVLIFQVDDPLQKVIRCVSCLGMKSRYKRSCNFKMKKLLF